MAVIPGTEPAMSALAGAEREFPDRVTVGVCSVEATEAALAKEVVARIARAVGLDTPPVGDCPGRWMGRRVSPVL